MLTRGEAASVYNNIIDILLNKDYYFHTIDGEDLHKGTFSFNTFLEKLPNFEYIDTEDQTYTKLYINPLVRMLLLIGASGTDVVDFNKISFELIEFVYDQLHESVSHGYRIALEDARKEISNLFKTDRTFDDSL